MRMVQKTVRLQLAIALALVAAPLSQARAADGDAGEAAYNNACRTCHSWKAGDNRLGPNLAGIIGRKAGAAEGFAYSQAMKNSGVVWDEATLDKFMMGPDAVVAGNNMKPFTAIDDAATRKAILDFLKSNPQ